jgi:hypothetical protein
MSHMFRDSLDISKSVPYLETCDSLRRNISRNTSLEEEGDEGGDRETCGRDPFEGGRILGNGAPTHRNRPVHAPLMVKWAIISLSIIHRPIMF